MHTRGEEAKQGAEPQYGRLDTSGICEVVFVVLRVVPSKRASTRPRTMLPLFQNARRDLGRGHNDARRRIDTQDEAAVFLVLKDCHIAIVRADKDAIARQPAVAR